MSKRKDLRDREIFEHQVFNMELSPEDKRDYKVEDVVKAVVALPEEYESKGTAILNQGSVGSCVAHSCATTMMTCEEKELNSHNDYSRGYIYANRAATDFKGEGMYPRQALKQLNKYGDVLYEDFPYNIEWPKILEQLEKSGKDELAIKAADHKIVSYFRCWDEYDIKTAVVKYGACLIAVPTYTDFSRNLHKPAAGATLRGHHAMVVVGWTKDGRWIVQNSWGKNWGYKGKLYMDFDYKIEEAWGICVSPDNVEPELTLWQKFVKWLKNLFKNLFKKNE